MIEVLLLNLSYVLMLVGLSLREILWMRTNLAGAQAFFILYGSTIGNPTMIAWNALFLTINLYQVFNYLKDRRSVAIPDGLEWMHSEVFHYLTPPDFVKLWQRGQETRAVDGWIHEAGTAPITLMVITAGEVEVHHRGRLVCTLERGQFLGEMEFCTGETLTVGFKARGPVTLHSWSRHEMILIGAENPRLCMRIQGVLGLSALRKMQPAAAS